MTAMHRCGVFGCERVIGALRWALGYRRCLRHGARLERLGDAYSSPASPSGVANSPM